MKPALLLAALALAGCQTLPQRVEVPMPVPCRVEIPLPPAWATGSLAPDAGIWDQVKALLAELEQRKGYEAKLEAAAKACQW